MAVAPLQIPGYAAPQTIDFQTPLAQLGQSYQQGQKRMLLADLAAGGNQDPRALIQAGLATGDMTLANLGTQALQHQQQAARQAAQDARQLQRDAVTDKQNAAYLSIARQNAARLAEDKPVYKEITRPDGTTEIIAINKGGTRSVYGGGPAAADAGNPFGPGKFNEGQGKAAGFTDRMLQSEGILSGVAPVGEGPPTPAMDTEGTSMAARGAAKIPLVGNFMVGENFQKYDQAKRDFINAQLRRESGAAISPTEFESADKQYFPLPGDTPQVIAQKRANRRAAISAMGREGGPSYRPESTFAGPNGMLQPRQTPAQRPQGQGRPISQQEYNALPPGTPFTAPDGTQRIKP